MKTFISMFFSMDIRIRATVLVALVIVIFWWILGKIIIRFASIFPYLLKGVFRGVYILIEAPVCWLHERTGSLFYGVDNGLANVGAKIDFFLGQWHMRWRNLQNRRIILSIVIYCAFLFLIYIPYDAENAGVNSFRGDTVYLWVERKLADFLEAQNLYGGRIEEAASYSEPEETEEEGDAEGVIMKVITKNDPLSIRNIPSEDECEILEQVERENTVIWKGEMAFRSGRNGLTEPWIKVETLAGTVGWARLIYLCPMNENDFELKLQW